VTRRAIHRGIRPVLRRVLLAAVVLLGTAAAPAYVATGPAVASTSGACAAGSGVTVVVDFHQLGGGVQERCDPGGGGTTAATIFPAAGFALSYAQSAPGAVCKVAGEPAQQTCVGMPPGDAYWSLWWTGPAGGSWTYASEGVDSLTIPAGGFVAFSWQGQDAKAPPGVAARHAAAAPPSSSAAGPSVKATPTAHPQASPRATRTSAPGATAAASHPSATAHSSPTATASATASASTSTTPSTGGGRRRTPSPPALSASPRPDTHTRSATGTAGSAGRAEADPGSQTPSGGPRWLFPLVVVVILIAVGLVTYGRRRRS
jgi:hypothetical protein